MDKLRSANESNIEDGNCRHLLAKHSIRGDNVTVEE